MLAKRVIPSILYRGRTLVKGRQFNSWRSVGNIIQAARIYAARNVDELIILDIGATPAGEGPDFDLVAQICDGNFCPVTVGGGVRSLDDVDKLLRAGADKVCIGTGGVELIESIASKFGSQAIVASIDVLSYRVWLRCGTRPTVWTAESYAWRCADSGAGEILLTSIEREGGLQGYDVDMIREVSQAVSIPVIANGGCGSYEDMAAALDAGASAVAAGAFFQFTEATPKGAAQFLHEHGYEVRL